MEPCGVLYLFLWLWCYIVSSVARALITRMQLALKRSTKVVLVYSLVHIKFLYPQTIKIWRLYAVILPLVLSNGKVNCKAVLKLANTCRVLRKFLLLSENARHVTPKTTDETPNRCHQFAPRKISCLCFLKTNHANANFLACAYRFTPLPPLSFLPVLSGNAVWFN